MNPGISIGEAIQAYIRFRQQPNRSLPIQIHDYLLILQRADLSCTTSFPDTWSSRSHDTIFSTYRCPRNPHQFTFLA